MFEQSKPNMGSCSLTLFAAAPRDCALKRPYAYHQSLGTNSTTPPALPRQADTIPDCAGSQDGCTGASPGRAGSRRRHRSGEKQAQILRARRCRAASRPQLAVCRVPPPRRRARPFIRQCVRCRERGARLNTGSPARHLGGGFSFLAACQLPAAHIAGGLFIGCSSPHGQPSSSRARLKLIKRLTARF